MSSSDFAKVVEIPEGSSTCIAMLDKDPEKVVFNAFVEKVKKIRCNQWITYDRFRWKNWPLNEPVVDGFKFYSGMLDKDSESI